jgi:hypothetical protein
MSDNGDSIIKVVNLFIENINESTKSTSKSLDNLCVKIDSVKTKLNTPPRNEELSAQLESLKGRLQTIGDSLLFISGILKKISFVSKVIVVGVPLTVLLVGGLIGYTKYIEVKKINVIEQRVTSEEKRLESLNSEMNFHLFQTDKERDAQKNKYLPKKDR